jgi:hypothetical protein
MLHESAQAFDFAFGGAEHCARRLADADRATQRGLCSEDRVIRRIGGRDRGPLDDERAVPDRRHLHSVNATGRGSCSFDPRPA